MIKLLLKVPTGIFSILLTAVVLYLCLAPQPVKSPGFFSFPGADKVVHGIMFFALTAVYLFDCRKMKHPRPISGAGTVMIGIAAILLGGAIEVVQELMALGRSMDPLDWLADACGVVCAVAAVPWLLGKMFAKSTDTKNC